LLIDRHVFFTDRQKGKYNLPPKSQSFSASRKVQNLACQYKCLSCLDAASKAHFVADNTLYNTDTIHRMFKKIVHVYFQCEMHERE